LKQRIVVRAVWDGEARVWVASSEDISGLALEAETIEALQRKIAPAIEDLIELNGLEFDLREIPVEVRSEAHLTVINPAHRPLPWRGSCVSLGRS
jgi:hypothetical protein